MDRRLLKITGCTAIGVAVLVALLFVFVDRHVDTAAYSLGGTFWYDVAEVVSLIGDHDWYNVWLLTGFFAGGVLALGRGLTPGVRNLLYLCVAVSIAMLIGETLKWFFGRYRPQAMFEQAKYGFAWFESKGIKHSFPSGHTMRLFSAMTALALIWPKARVPFLALALLVGISRVVVTRHYPSDIVAGAFVGVFCALWTWRIMQGWREGRGGSNPPRDGAQ